MDGGKPAMRMYNDKEVGELIQRATELHEEKAGASSRNLSLTEVEHIAAELGLSPEDVRTAALELEGRTDSGKGFSLWGGPFVIDHARAVAEQMTEEQWERVVQEIRKFTGSTGQISEIGRTREWFRSTEDAGTTLEMTLVTLRPEADGTAIQIRKNFSGAAVLSYIIAFFAGATAAGIALDGGGLPDLLNIAIVGGGGVGALAAVRASISMWTGRQKRRLIELADKLHFTLMTSTPEAPAGEPTRARVELPDLDPAEQSPLHTRTGLRS